MFPELIENAAKYLIVESIRDESLGDLWESNYNLTQQGIPKLLRITIFVWNFLLLIRASVVLLFERKGSEVLRRLNSSLNDTESSIEPPDDSNTLTPEILKRIRQYCNLRRFYAPVLSQRLMGHIDVHDSYWIRQTDRIIDKCQHRGDHIVDCEVIVNGFILSNFVRRIETLPPKKVTIDLLHDFVSDVNLTEDFINRYVKFDDRDYKRQLIFQTRSLAVYVISWKPGQESWLHHHGYALDAIKVIRGKMTHWLVSLDQLNGFIPFEYFQDQKRYEGPSDTFSTGDIIVIDRGKGHQIANLSNTNLVTLHFRFGYPPEDDHWRSTTDTEMFVWNQTERCFDLIRPHGGGLTTALW